MTHAIAQADPTPSDLKVCFLAGTLGPGGAERQLYYMLRTLREHHVDVRLLSVTRGEFWEPHIRSLGVPVVWIGGAPSRAARLRRIIAAVRAQRAKILQSQHFYMNLYATAAARATGAREIGAIRNDVVSEMADTGRFFARPSLRWPRLVAGNSQAGLHNASAQGAREGRLFLLPNVVDTKRFAPMPRLVNGHHGVRIVTAARLTAQKRLDRFLTVVARVRSDSPDVTGAIAGAGHLGDDLSRDLLGQAEREGLLPDGVMFGGVVEDMAAFYRSADVFLLTSDYEGTPNVVLEAMACGLPVVATKAGGIPDVVEHGVTGLLADPTDVDGLTASVRRLVHDRELRQALGCRAQAYVAKHHSFDRLYSSLTELYQRALS